MSSAASAQPPGRGVDADVDVDVIVVGGGVNGAGVARDCAQRGLRVALFERNDVAFGASGNNSGMIHGGPRYLTYDPDVTYTSCLDSGHIQRIAPHLLFRIPFLMPVHRERRGARLALTLFDAFFDLYDRYQPLKHGKPHARLTTEELQQLEPGLAGQTVGGVSFDEWGIDGVRLTVANLVDAREAGARVQVHTTVTEILRREDGAVRGVRYRDLLSGDSGSCSARVVVNATGAWAPLTAAMGGLVPEQARIRPGKGIHVFFDRRLTNYAIAVAAIDGRRVFLEPWQNMSVIGTTDTDYYGDLDDVVATTAEVRYLVQAVARVFPAIVDARAMTILEPCARHRLDARVLRQRDRIDQLVTPRQRRQVCARALAHAQPPAYGIRHLLREHAVAGQLATDHRI
jgi:glycerol-3-phosphate dehydrogenase